MKVIKYDTEEEWLADRRGKVTGTKAGKLKAKRGGYLKGFYELIAEKVSLPDTEENRMARGKRLEESAVDRFSKETGKELEYNKVLCLRDDDNDIAFSPDALITAENASVEVKCLAGASHIQAYIEQCIPDEYLAQALQPFCVNDDQNVLYFVFYNPECVIDFFYLTLTREEYSEAIETQLREQKEILTKVREYEKQFMPL